MRWAMTLVGGVGLLAFGGFMAAISHAIGRPSGSTSADSFTRALVDVALVGGLVCVAIGAVAAIAGFVGMRRAEARRAAVAEVHAPGDDNPPTADEDQ